jgi:hypothetical protein
MIIRSLLLLIFMTLTTPIEGLNRVGQHTLHAYCKNVQQTQGWQLIAEGSRNYDVECKILHFLSKQRVSLPEARVLVVSETQKLLDQLNNTSNGRQAKRGPNFFTIENLSYSIAFKDGVAPFVCDPYIAHVLVVRDRIFYEKYDSLSEQLIDVYEESYDEALAIVRGETDSPLACQ